MMQRRAFKMQLKSGCLSEYKLRHEKIWPKLSELLSAHGIFDYSIFLDEDTLALFAVMKVRPESNIADLADHPIMKDWWHYMEPLMVCEPSSRPKEWPLFEIFHHS